MGARAAVAVGLALAAAACAGPAIGPDDGADDRADAAPGTRGDAATAPPFGSDATPIPNPDPANTWVNVTGNLAGMASECGNLSFLSARPGDDDVMIAGVAQRGLWATHDGGATWAPLGAGGGSAPITNRTSAIVYDPTDPDVFWESGIYNGAGVYKTIDGGTTFTGAWLHHNDLVAVDFGDPARATLLVSGHEQARTLSLSRDGGASWDDVGDALPAGTAFSSAPLVLDRDTFLVGCTGWGGGDAGIYRSTDGAGSFGRVFDQGGAGAPLRARDGTIYWANPYGGTLARSSDGGATWDTTAGGVSSVPPIELPDGRIATIGSRTILLSADRGATWTPVGPALGFDPAVLAYSTIRRAFYVSRWDCGDRVLDDAVSRFHFDYATE